MFNEGQYKAKVEKLLRENGKYEINLKDEEEKEPEEIVPVRDPTIVEKLKVYRDKWAKEMASSDEMSDVHEEED